MKNIIVDIFVATIVGHAIVWIPIILFYLSVSFITWGLLDLSEEAASLRFFELVAILMSIYVFVEGERKSNKF